MAWVSLNNLTRFYTKLKEKFYLKTEVDTRISELNNKIRINYLRPTLQTTTQNGVTCTNNGDGTYTFNGTATSACYFYVGNFERIGKFKLVGMKTNYHSCPMYIYIDSKYYNDLGEGVVFENNSVGDIYIYIVNGATVNNLIVKPMITDDLTATYDDFIPFDDSLAVNQLVAQKSDVLTYEEIQASTDLNEKIASASSIKTLYATTYLPKRVINNCNDAIAEGMYTVGFNDEASNHNAPSNYGVMLTINPHGYDYIGQLYLSITGTGCYYRGSSDGGAGWTSWIML